MITELYTMICSRTCLSVGLHDDARIYHVDTMQYALDQVYAMMIIEYMRALTDDSIESDYLFVIGTDLLGKVCPGQ